MLDTPDVEKQAREQVERTRWLFGQVVRLASAHAGVSAVGEPITRWLSSLLQSPANRVVLSELSQLNTEQERRTFIEQSNHPVLEMLGEVVVQLGSLHRDTETQVGSLAAELSALRESLATDTLLAPSSKSGVDLDLVPVGPAVPAMWIGVDVVREIASQTSSSLAPLLVNSASDKVHALGGSKVVHPWELPDPTRLALVEFWSSSLLEARLCGPRMLAALLMEIEREVLSGDTEAGPSAVRRLLDRVLATGVGRAEPTSGRSKA